MQAPIEKEQARPLSFTDLSKQQRPYVKCKDLTPSTAAIDARDRNNMVYHAVVWDGQAWQKLQPVYNRINNP